MFVRDMRRVIILIIPTAILLYLVLSFTHGSLAPSGLIDQAFSKGSPAQSTTPDVGDAASSPYHLKPSPNTHKEVSSLSTPDGRYFLVDFGPGQEGAINPNIIPHPTDDGVYAIVAQEVARGTPTFHEIACYASFNGSVLSCNEPARALPIEPTRGLPCPKKYELLDLNAGPHDARVFWGPHSAYTIYGSNSKFSCFGQFIQNFPVLMDWTAEMAPQDLFRTGTEIERPGKHGDLEKNWFVFWDSNNQIYAHYDVRPRAFAKLAENGSVGADLGPLAAATDTKCLDRHMPTLKSEDESIHQATNSLSVTLCKRSDPACSPDASNTVAFTIFHHKTFKDMHSVYEPYVMAFKQEAPFEVYGVSKKPLWIHGRGTRDDGVTEMMFVTSISWKGRTQRYHGYLDDTMFLGFGIEDKGTGGIDVLAGDILAELGLCSDV